MAQGARANPLIARNKTPRLELPERRALRKAAATAFFWGASEAVLNRFWPPFYTWHPDRLSEAAYGRSVFYGALVLTVTVIAAVVAAGRKLIVPRKERAGPREDAVIVWPYKLFLKRDDMSRRGKYFNLRRDPGEREPLQEDETSARLRLRIQS